MPKLTFKFIADDESQFHETRALIDGQDLFVGDDENYVGLDPDDFFTQPALRSSGELHVGCCNCGVLSCGSVEVEVIRTENQVEWRVGPDESYSFDPAQYDSSIEAAAKDASWETPGRRAEKRIEQLDFTGCFSDGKPLIWVSTREKQDHILMLFGTQYQQELVELPWSPKDEEHAVASVRAWIESRANKVRE